MRHDNDERCKDKTIKVCVFLALTLKSVEPLATFTVPFVCRMQSTNLATGAPDENNRADVNNDA